MERVKTSCLFVFFFSVIVGRLKKLQSVFKADLSDASNPSGLAVGLGMTKKDAPHNAHEEVNLKSPASARLRIWHLIFQIEEIKKY